MAQVNEQKWQSTETALPDYSKK